MTVPVLDEIVTPKATTFDVSAPPLPEPTFVQLALFPDLAPEPKTLVVPTVEPEAIALPSYRDPRQLSLFPEEGEAGEREKAGN